MYNFIKVKQSKSNFLIISNSSSYINYTTFISIKNILDKNKKFYKSYIFKKIPSNRIVKIYVKYLDIILEFSNFIYNNKFLKLIDSKLSFKIKLIQIVR
uniref:Ribosomal protein L16 n=1 Tax=Hepatozoon canis TaxID=110120 RepID=A0A3Q8TJS3_9APIC|nr:ribosomal protein L16 [Hepatozoon canis]